ncbi:MAG: hypothetical protein ACHQ4G_05415 [Opitutales bacterium]
MLPRSLDGLTVDTHLLGLPVQLVYRVRSAAFAPTAVRVNGALLPGDRRDSNPYRAAGPRVAAAEVAARLRESANRIVVEL